MSSAKLPRLVKRRWRSTFAGCALVVLMCISTSLVASAADAEPTLAAVAANFYVAINGKDSWSGRLSAPNSKHTDGPFASVARAQKAVKALLQSHPSSPIVVMVREGTYYLPLSSTRPGTLNFTAADSGTATVSVTWENYPDEVPVLDGGIPVSGWSRVSGDRWQVQLPANTQPFESLYYNGERRLRSRIQSPAAGVGYYMSGGSCISS
ncbi:MAG: hypothetical protein WBM11_12615, partial [Terriglobales bacterium]